MNDGWRVSLSAWIHLCLIGHQSHCSYCFLGDDRASPGPGTPLQAGCPGSLRLCGASTRFAGWPGPLAAASLSHSVSF